MTLRYSTKDDVLAIMKIIDDAQKYLAQLKIDQWQDGYPTEEQILIDINNNDSYVVIDDAGKVMCTTVFTTKKEPTYQNVDGNWLTKEDAKYGVIHRLAVSENFRGHGIAKFIFDECENKLNEMNVCSMRIDTHRDNVGMQKMLKKRGYIYCGIIYLDSGDERLAFEKLLR